jgi:hypothetical protein
VVNDEQPKKSSHQSVDIGQFLKSGKSVRRTTNV